MAKRGFRILGFVLILAGIIGLLGTTKSINGFSILGNIDALMGSFMIAVLFIGGLLFLWLGNRDEE